MSAVWAWLRVDLRRRLRSLAVLALLVALSAVSVLTALAGARRGASAVERLLAQTAPATVAVLPNEPGFDWEAVRALPGVEALARFPLSSYELEGFAPEEGGDFVYVDDEIMRRIERPVLLEGRLADPARDDEAVVTSGMVDTYGLGPGDTVTVLLYTPEQIDRGAGGEDVGTPGGPRIQTRIVGVVRSGWFSDTPDLPGRVIPSPGLYTRHEANLVGTQGSIFFNALIRLEDGPAGIPAFRERLAEVSGRRDIEFMDLAEEAAHLVDVAGFEADALLAFAAAAAISALFLIGQAVSRHVAGSTSDLEVLRACGMSHAQVRTAATVGPALAAVAGTLVGAGTAYLLSSWFPIGTVAPVEPSPGRDLDVLVLGVGLLAIPAAVTLGSFVVAWRSGGADDAGRESVLASWAARAGAPVPVRVGTRFALERGRRSQAVPVRPALLGAVVGVLGVVAALTFAAGVSDATEHPARFGQTSELQAFLGFNGEDFLPTESVLPVIADDPDVAAVNDSRQSVAEAGHADIAVYSFDPSGEALEVVVTEGRMAEGQDEVLLAPASAAAVGVEPGDSVELTGTGEPGVFTVSGVGFVPSGPHNDYDAGAWAPDAAYRSLFGDGFKFHTVDVAVRPGADPQAVAARVGAAVADEVGQPEMASEVLSPRPAPLRLAELQEVQRLPLYLAAFLAVLAVGAVGHALAVAVRRRRHDLAVLRALGVTRWQCRLVVVAQASLLAIVGLIVGVPAGMALGRILWRWVATDTPLAYVPPLALGVLVLIAPVALVVANLLAAWPSQRAASTPAGVVLRRE